MVSMINKAILRKDLGKLPSVKGMVRKSDVMAVVGKQKVLSLEPKYWNFYNRISPVLRIIFVLFFQCRKCC